MIMRTIQLNIPDSVDLKDYDFSIIVAAKLYENAKLFSGQGKGNHSSGIR